MTTAVLGEAEAQMDEHGLQESNEQGLVDAHAYSVIAAIDADIGKMDEVLLKDLAADPERVDTHR